MIRYQSNTVELATLILDKFLNHAAGDKDVEIDDIVVAYREFKGKSISLSDAKSIVKTRLPAALKYIWDVEQWHYVPVSAYYFATFANGRPRRLGDSDTTEVEVKRCVAGIGRASATIGLHFLVDKDDWLFVWHNAHGTRNGFGKVHANIGRAHDLAESGQLTEQGVTGISAGAGQLVTDTKRQIKRLRELVPGR
jgi:hypothetical protein